MGKFGKWIAGGLGWALFGPLGGILGFALGSVMEGGVEVQKQTGRRVTTTGDFAMSLLVLVSAVMKADEEVLDMGSSLKLTSGSPLSNSPSGRDERNA